MSLFWWNLFGGRVELSDGPSWTSTPVLYSTQWQQDCDCRTGLKRELVMKAGSTFRPICNACGKDWKLMGAA